MYIDIVKTQQWVISEKHKRFHLGLCHEHAVERISMMKGKLSGTKRMYIENREGFNAILCDFRCQKYLRNIGEW